MRAAEAPSLIEMPTAAAVVFILCGVWCSNFSSVRTSKKSFSDFHLSHLQFAHVLSGSWLGTLCAFEKRLVSSSLKGPVGRRLLRSDAKSRELVYDDGMF